MIIARILLAATVAASIVAGGSAVALLTGATASAAALTEGTYRFDFEGSKQTTNGTPSPVQPYSWWLAIRSACPPPGCVATATVLDANNHSVAQGPANTWVYRENNRVWEASRFQGFACAGQKTAGSATQSFQVTDAGTLIGVATDFQAPCGPVVTPFTAERVGELPPGVDVADPNTA